MSDNRVDLTLGTKKFVFEGWKAAVFVWTFTAIVCAGMLFVAYRTVVCSL